MKKILVLLMLFGTGAAAQPNSTVPKNIRATNVITDIVDTNGLGTTDNFYGIPLEPGDVVGTAYLSPEWKKSIIHVYDSDKKVDGYYTRYEIARDQIEIRTAQGIRVLHGRQVRSFAVVDSISHAPHNYVNAADYKNEDGVALTGFLEVLAQGTHTLVAKTSVIVRKPTYNEKFDTGDRDTKVMRKTAFYYLDDGVIRELPSSRKKLLTVFGKDAEPAAVFMRKNELSLKDASHLKVLFEHVNRSVTN